MEKLLSEILREVKELNIKYENTREEIKELKADCLKLRGEIQILNSSCKSTGVDKAELEKLNGNYEDVIRDLKILKIEQKNIQEDIHNSQNNHEQMLAKQEKSILKGREYFLAIHTALERNSELIAKLEGNKKDSFSDVHP